MRTRIRQTKFDLSSSAASSKVFAKVKYCLLFISILLGTTGCFGVRAVEPASALEELDAIRADWQPAEARPAQPKVLRQATFTVAAPKDLGCIVTATQPPAEQALGSHHCAAFSIQGDDAEAYIKQRNKTVDGLVGVHIKSFGRVAHHVIASRLSQRFQSPQVRFVPQQAEGVLEFYQGMGTFGAKRVLVQLSATNEQGQRIVTNGNGSYRYSAAHIAWGAPMMLALMPFGPGIVTYIWQAGELGAIERSFVQSIDIAAADLAAQLAAHGAGQAWRIEVMLAPAASNPSPDTAAKLHSSLSQ